MQCTKTASCHLSIGLLGLGLGLGGLRQLRLRLLLLALPLLQALLVQELPAESLVPAAGPGPEECRDGAKILKN